jgi:hypothetical protein
MTEKFDFGSLRKSRYDTTKPAVEVKPPTPPSIDEGMIDMMKRRAGQFGQKHLIPLSEAMGVGVRAGTDLATFHTGIPDKLESLYNTVTGQPQPDPELVAAERQRVDKEHPTAATVGKIAGAAGQAGAASRLLGQAVPALGRPTPGSQAANQGIVGGGQAASQNIAEAIKEGRPIDPTRLALSTIAGTTFGAAGGALASKAAGWTPRGRVSQTIPEGLSAAERTALAQQAQRGQAAGAGQLDLATLMRLSGHRQAPVIEREMQRGITGRTGEPLDVVPPGLTDRLTQTQSALTQADARTATRQAGTIRQAEKDIARLRAQADIERAATPTLNARTSPRIEEVRKQVMDEGRLGVNPSPPRGYSPEIYEETYRRLGDLGHVREQRILQQMMDRAMPGSFAHRQAAERLADLRANGLPPSPASRRASDEIRNLEEIQGAVTNRPAAPEPSRSTRGRELSATSGWGGPSFRYRGSGGSSAPGPTVERAARMMQDQPEVAAGLLGQVLPGQTAGASIGSAAVRIPVEDLATDFFGLRPPQPRKRKSQ